MIETQEDATAYLSNVQQLLTELARLSQDAGLNTHASIWYAIMAAFVSGARDVETISDMMLMFTEAKIKELGGE